MSMLICPVTGVYLCLVASPVSRAICALKMLWTQELGLPVLPAEIPATRLYLQPEVW